jgi:fructose-1,6-bisphosphatase/inositol monophosphatase family enzyme
LSNDNLTSAERDALNSFGEGQPTAKIGDSPSQEDLRSFLLRCGLASIRVARGRKFGNADGRITARALTGEIEKVLKNLVKDSGLSASFIAEGLGADYLLEGRTVVVDPIDGELAYSNAAANFATSTAIFMDTKVEAALVANPSTGEMIYSVGDQTRLLQLGAGGSEPGAAELPLASHSEGTILLNLSSSQSLAAPLAAAMTAWTNADIQLVTMNGGSPAWAIAECAMGSSAYVNLWSASETFPYELAAGVEVLRKAGGEVKSLSGVPIDALSHLGPFVAGTSNDICAKVLKAVGPELRKYAESARSEW